MRKVCSEVVDLALQAAPHLLWVFDSCMHMSAGQSTQRIECTSGYVPDVPHWYLCANHDSNTPVEGTAKLVLHCYEVHYKCFISVAAIAWNSHSRGHTNCRGLGAQATED